MKTERNEKLPERKWYFNTGNLWLVIKSERESLLGARTKYRFPRLPRAKTFRRYFRRFCRVKIFNGNSTERSTRTKEFSSIRDDAQRRESSFLSADEIGSLDGVESLYEKKRKKEKKNARDETKQIEDVEE